MTLLETSFLIDYENGNDLAKQYEHSLSIFRFPLITAGGPRAFFTPPYESLQPRGALQETVDSTWRK